MSRSALDLLGRSPYLLLVTFRRDGSAVPTPVWVVGDDNRLLVWSAPEVGKIKRIRRDGRVLVAPCSVFGQPFGRLVQGTARLITDPAAVPDLLERLRHKYGLLGRLTLFPHRIGRWLGRPRPAVGIAISLSDGSE